MGPRPALLERSGLRRPRPELGVQRPPHRGRRLPRLPLHRRVLVRAVQQATSTARSSCRPSATTPRSPSSASGRDWRARHLKHVSTDRARTAARRASRRRVEAPRGPRRARGLRHPAPARADRVARWRDTRRPRALAVLDVVARRARGTTADAGARLDGPEAPAGTARDTAVVLRELFEGARESVILAGYSFDHAAVLAPLHRDDVRARRRRAVLRRRPSGRRRNRRGGAPRDAPRRVYALRYYFVNRPRIRGAECVVSHGGQSVFPWATPGDGDAKTALRLPEASSAA